MTTRIATWNLERAARPDRLAGELSRHHALHRTDVLLVQEIEHHAREATARLDRLAQALAFPYIYYAQARTWATGSHGLAVLARAPIVDPEIVPLPSPGVGRYNAPRIALAVTVGDLRIVNVHLDTRLDADQRVVQLAPAIAAAARAPKAILAGDFNTTPFRFWRNNLPIGAADQHAAVDAAAAARGLANATRRLGPTTRRTLFAWRLDAIYTRGVEVEHAGIAREIRTSDHIPLWIDLTS
ncbi:MAG TPA: endonuclease/exonuclease/phosphatase family protein [Kofleriaceae bacterium]|nr:endonuclease/exonuclease/phosphatase family protein [Kofleriaceae bacterium]